MYAPGSASKFGKIFEPFGVYITSEVERNEAYLEELSSSVGNDNGGKHYNIIDLTETTGF